MEESKSVVLARINQEFPGYWKNLADRLGFRPLKAEEIPSLLGIEVVSTSIPPNEIPGSIEAKVRAKFQLGSLEPYTLEGNLHSSGYDSFSILFTSNPGSNKRTVEEEIGEYAFFGSPSINVQTWDHRPN